MLKSRVITALVLGSFFMGSIIFLPTDYLAFVVGLVVLVGAWEWSALSGFSSQVSRIAYCVLLLVIMASTYSWIHRSGWFDALLYGVFIWWLVVLLWLHITPARQVLSNTFNVYLRALTGLVLLLPAWLSFLALHAIGDRGVLLLLCMLCIVWAADSGAFFAGRLFGNTRLASEISPGKSLEGVYGGLLATAVVAILMSVFLGYDFYQAALFVLLAIFIAIFSIIGDLFESVAKRAAGVKDSGQIFPGHGGVMDRIDSLTAAAPLFVLSLGWFSRLL